MQPTEHYALLRTSRSHHGFPVPVLDAAYKTAVQRN